MGAENQTALEPVLEAAPEAAIRVVDFDNRESESVWRREWEKLDRHKEPVHKCVSGCGHAESAHTFATVTVNDCANNCRVCRKKEE